GAVQMECKLVMVLAGAVEINVGKIVNNFGHSGLRAGCGPSIRPHDWLISYHYMMFARPDPVSILLHIAANGWYLSLVRCHSSALSELGTKAKSVRDSINDIIKTPENIWNGLGASGAAIKAEFPTRLVGYIIYEFITKSHPKIGGVFLLFGVLRREFTRASSAA